MSDGGRGLGENLVFIVGCPRSGMTWVQRLLGAHPSVRIGQESFVFSTYVGPQLRSWRWERRRELNPATASGRDGIGLPAYLREEQFLVRLKEYADRLLEPMVGTLGPGELFVDKSPTHARFIAEIKLLYPGARFIHVLRDPRDVAASWLTASQGWGRGWATNSLKVPVQQWLGHVGSVRDAERWMHGWDIYELVYERLFQSPREVLAELTAFLGLSWDEPAIRRAIEDNRADALRAGGGTRIPVAGEVTARTGSSVMREPVGFVGTARPGSWRGSLGIVDRVYLWKRLRKAMKRERYQWRRRDWLAGPIRRARSATTSAAPNAVADPLSSIV